MIEFVAYGVPIPKGSTRAFFRPGMKYPVVTADNKQSKPWQESVVAAARDVVGAAAPLLGPIFLTVEFYVPRPASAPRKVVHALKKPDLDKLLRCIKDALTRAGVYHDDAQVVASWQLKLFAGGQFDREGPRGIPRAVIRVRELEVETRAQLVTTVEELPLFRMEAAKRADTRREGRPTRRWRALGINPGGQCLSFALPPDKVPPSTWRNRLLTREQCALADAAVEGSGG